VAFAFTISMAHHNKGKTRVALTGILTIFGLMSPDIKCKKVDVVKTFSSSFVAVPVYKLWANKKKPKSRQKIIDTNS
jgi:hypothetical protein